ncbi:hypothetical protein FBZ89_103223 [Nitrospirillum amazonense]|uniref:Uncharacterized protein n=1 Tax=Nitrospirillum amazonense TaxID=28077 RepID=A0A560FM01_9PROT|nr:hypothetical protein [Nitrospirillum amazonense]TWB22600.1 hypothetical protein FBZ89_103223 [Nitrospirillum amazonense]
MPRDYSRTPNGRVKMGATSTRQQMWLSHNTNSGAELRAIFELIKHGWLDVDYESVRLDYYNTIEKKIRKWKPDFHLKDLGNTLLEVKGQLTWHKDRQKLLDVRHDNPEWTIIICMDSKYELTGTRTGDGYDGVSALDWANAHGFMITTTAELGSFLERLGRCPDEVAAWDPDEPAPPAPEGFTDTEWAEVWKARKPPVPVLDPPDPELLAAYQDMAERYEQWRQQETKRAETRERWKASAKRYRERKKAEAELAFMTGEGAA